MAEELRIEIIALSEEERALGSQGRISYLGRCSQRDW